MEEVIAQLNETGKEYKLLQGDYEFTSTNTDETQEKDYSVIDHFIGNIGGATVKLPNDFNYSKSIDVVKYASWLIEKYSEKGITERKMNYKECKEIAEEIVALSKNEDLSDLLYTLSDHLPIQATY
jgi:hypothetical protein